MSTVEERIAALKAQANKGDGDERYPAWDVSKLDDGAVLAGVMIRGDHVMTRDGKDARLMIIEEVGTDERYTVWCSSKMLRDFVIEKAPPVGALIVIEYHGKFPVQSQPDRKFNKIVAVTDEDPDFKYWDGLREVMQRKDAEFAANAPGGAPAAMTTPSYGPDEAPF